MIASSLRILGAFVFRARAETPQITESVWKKVTLSYTSSAIFLLSRFMNSCAYSASPLAWFELRERVTVLKRREDGDVERRELEEDLWG